MVEQVLGVLSEAFEGPQETWSYFTDSGRDGGLFGTLERLDAEVASRVLGRTTIAAHVNHVTFGLHASARWIEGDRTTHKWDESWSVSSVDGEEWVRAKDGCAPHTGTYGAPWRSLRWKAKRPWQGQWAPWPTWRTISGQSDRKSPSSRPGVEPRAAALLTSSPSENT